MQYSDTSNNLGIVQQIDFLCDSDTTAYPNSQKNREVNQALEELVGEIVSADGTWQWDDTNNTNLPVGTGTLVQAQQTYSFAAEYLDITMIEVLNRAGDRYEKIVPLDYSQLGDLSPQQYFGTETSGSPRLGAVQYYDKIGDTIYLYMTPSSTYNTLTNGIRVWFKRTASLFAASDTTKEPGLPSTYHSILSYMAAIPYCMKYKKDRVPLYQAKVMDMKRNLLKFYGRREKDVRKVATTKPIAFR